MSTWTSRTLPNNNWYYSIVYGNNVFVATGTASSTVNNIITSTNGITWNTRTVPASTPNVYGITYGIVTSTGTGLFVGVGGGSGSTNRILTSPNGTTWTAQTYPGTNNWWKVTYGVVNGSGLFVAVAFGVSDIMTSSNGTAWTLITPTGSWGANIISWNSIGYGNGLFVAVSGSSYIITSSDGSTWTERTSPVSGLYSVTYGNGLFVAVSIIGGLSQKVATSPNGINWTAQTTPLTNNGWTMVTYANGLFVAVSYDGEPTTRVMTSPDGINWTIRTTNPVNDWRAVTSGNNILIAVGTSFGNAMTAPVLTYGNLLVNATFNKIYKDASFNLNPTTNSGGSITYTSRNANIATVNSSGIVTIGNVGTTSINLFQAETSTYWDASVNTTITVNKATPTLTIPNFTRNYSDPVFSVLPNISTNNTEGPSYSYISNNPLIANIVNGNVTIGNAGSANIVITQSATTNYTSITANTTITVNKLTANLNFPSSFTRNYSDPVFSVLPNISTNNTDGPTYSYSSNNPLIANIVNGNVTIGNAGTTNIVLTQSETTNYTTISANTTITVNKTSPTLTIPNYTRTFNDPSFSILPNISTNNTEGPTYSYISDSPLVADIVDGIVTIGNSGIANIVLTQSETTNYTSITATTTITIINQLTANLTIPSSFTRTYNDASFSILPNISTNNTEGPTYSYISDSPLIANIVDGIVTIGNAGIANIVVSQSETLHYTSITANTSIIVNKSSASLTFPASFTRTYNDASFSILPNISTNNTEGPAYSYSSNFPLIANIVDGVVTIGNMGIANIILTQSETTNYMDISATTSITVNKSTPNLSFPASFTRTYNDASFSILPNISTNNTEGPAYSYSSNFPLIANIVDGVVTIGNTGIANIILTQSETTNYMDISATTSITVNKSTPNLSFPAIFTRTYNDASFSILPNISTNNTEGPAYSYSSNFPLIANIVDGVVTIGNAGIANIVLTQSATTNYTDISAVTSITVNKLTAVLTVPAIFTRTYNDASFSILPNISTTNTDPYSTRIITYQSDNSSVANIVAGIVTIGNAGNARIELYQPETTNYFAVTANTNIQVSRKVSVINNLPFYNINYKNKTPFHLNATTNNTETSIIYTSLDTNIATVDASGVVTIGNIIGNVGNTSIQLYQSETVNYFEVTATTFINVGIVVFEKQFSLEWNGQLFVLTIRNDTRLTSNYLYSYDGMNWSSATDLSNSAFLINKNPYNIKWTGTDYAMIGDLTTATGNTILKSKTGIHYSTLTTNTISPMFDLEANLEFPHTITFPRNMTLALGGLSADSVKIAYSIDEGITWLPTANSSATFNTTANNAVWNGKLWVAVGSANNTIATSTNGIDWVGRGSYIFTTEGFGIAWSNEQAQFIGAGSGTHALAYSYDGVYWMGLGTSMLSVAYDVQWNGSIWVATGVAVANNKSIAYSYDGRTWLNPTQTNLFDIAGKKLSWNGVFWMVVGSSTSSNSYYNIGISNDGIVWNMIFNNSFADTTITNLYSNELITLVPTLTKLLYASKYNELSTTSLQTINQLSSTKAVGYNGSYYLVGGNAVITSTDGNTWSSSVIPISNMSSINQFAWNHPDKGCPLIKPMTIACGEGNNTLAYSSDGIYWKGLGKTVFTTRANRAIWNGTLWVAVGTGQYWVATSYDGIQWLGRDINGLIEGYDIAWNGTAFVAVGYGNNASMAMSFDGVIWNPIPDSNVFFANGASAITWTGKCWLAYGSGTNTSMVCTNTDGWRWTPTTPANLVISNMTSAINTTGYGNATASSTQYIGLS